MEDGGYRGVDYRGAANGASECGAPQGKAKDLIQIICLVSLGPMLTLSVQSTYHAGDGFNSVWGAGYHPFGP